LRITTFDQLNHPMEGNQPEIILSRFGPDMLERWDVDPDGLMYLMPSTSNDPSDTGSKERVIAINGETMASQNVGTVVGPSPAGDLVFSTGANEKSFVYVKQGLKEGDIGFLVFESAQ